jgi:hypothetical protein
MDTMDTPYDTPSPDTTYTPDTPMDTPNDTPMDTPMPSSTMSANESSATTAALWPTLTVLAGCAAVGALVLSVLQVTKVVSPAGALYTTAQGQLKVWGTASVAGGADQPQVLLGTEKQGLQLNVVADNTTYLVGTAPAGDTQKLFLGTKNNGPLVLATNNVPRIHIGAEGNVGLGANAPTQHKVFMDVTSATNTWGMMIAGTMTKPTPGNLAGLAVQPDIRVNTGYTSFGITSQPTYRAVEASTANHAVGCYVDLNLQGVGATFNRVTGLLVGQFYKGVPAVAAVAAIPGPNVGAAFGIHVHRPAVATDTSNNINALFESYSGDARIWLANSNYGLVVKGGIIGSGATALPRGELTLRAINDTNVYPSMVIRATGAGGGFFEFGNLNLTNLDTYPNSGGGNGGLALSWNGTTNQAEVNFWNTYTDVASNPAGFDFRQLRVNAAGVKSHVQLMTINSNGLLLGIPNMRLTPVNTAPSAEGVAGDIRVDTENYYIYVCCKATGSTTTHWRRVALSAI